MNPKFGWLLTNRPYWERADLLDPPAPYFCRASIGCSRSGVWNIKHRGRYVGQSHYWCDEHLPAHYRVALNVLMRVVRAAGQSAMDRKAT